MAKSTDTSPAKTTKSTSAESGPKPATGNPLPVRPPELPESVAARSQPSDAERALTQRLDLIHDHNERAMGASDTTLAMLKRAQGDFGFLQAWAGEVLTRELATAPRRLETLVELEPAMHTLLKLGSTIVHFEKCIAGYRSEAETRKRGPAEERLANDQMDVGGTRNGAGVKLNP